MGLCLLEELVSTGWHEDWNLPARRGQGSREKMDIPGHDWAGNGHTRYLWGRFLPQALWQTILTGFAGDFCVFLKNIKKSDSFFSC